jgi:dihydrofolate reductase
LAVVLAEGFIPVWKERAADPSADVFTHKMVNTPKVVFSKTLTENHLWENTALANGDIVEEINNLKKQPGGDIVAYGGARFASALIKHNLIDEYHLFVNPAAIGKGMSIYNALEEKLSPKTGKSHGSLNVALLCFAITRQ